MDTSFQQNFLASELLIKFDSLTQSWVVLCTLLNNQEEFLGLQTFRRLAHCFAAFSSVQNVL